MLGLVGAAVAFRGRFDAAALQACVESAGTAGPIVFIAIYAVATMAVLARRSHHARGRCPVFMLPGALAHAWLGHAGRQALEGDAGMVRNGLIALAPVCVAAFLPRWLRKLRAQPMLDVDTLEQQLERGEHVLLLDVRDAAEFNGHEGRIPGATNQRLAELPGRRRIGVRATTQL